MKPSAPRSGWTAIALLLAAVVGPSGPVAALTLNATGLGFGNSDFSVEFEEDPGDADGQLDIDEIVSFGGVTIGGTVFTQIAGVPETAFSNTGALPGVAPLSYQWTFRNIGGQSAIAWSYAVSPSGSEQMLEATGLGFGNSDFTVVFDDGLATAPDGQLDFEEIVSFSGVTLAGHFMGTITNVPETAFSNVGAAPGEVPNPSQWSFLSIAGQNAIAWSYEVVPEPGVAWLLGLCLARVLARAARPTSA